MIPFPSQEMIFRSDVPGRNFAENIFARWDVTRSVRTFAVYGSVTISLWSSDPDKIHWPVSLHWKNVKNQSKLWQNLMVKNIHHISLLFKQIFIELTCKVLTHPRWLSKLRSKDMRWRRDLDAEIDNGWFLNKSNPFN